MRLCLYLAFHIKTYDFSYPAIEKLNKFFGTIYRQTYERDSLPKGDCIGSNLIHLIANEQCEAKNEYFYERRGEAINNPDHLQTPELLHDTFGATCFAAATPATAPAALTVVWVARELAAPAAVCLTPA